MANFEGLATLLCLEKSPGNEALRAAVAETEDFWEHWCGPPAVADVLVPEVQWKVVYYYSCSR